MWQTYKENIIVFTVYVYNKLFEVKMQFMLQFILILWLIDH